MFYNKIKVYGLFGIVRNRCVKKNEDYYPVVPETGIFHDWVLRFSVRPSEVQSHTPLVGLVLGPPVCREDLRRFRLLNQNLHLLSIKLIRQNFYCHYLVLYENDTKHVFYGSFRTDSSLASLHSTLTRSILLKSLHEKSPV